jgi:microcystin degradation protein MlrC
MVEAADAIVGYKHYPHDDTRETGERAAVLLLRAVRGEVALTMAQAKLPLLLTAFNSATLGDTPFFQLMEEAKTLEGEAGVLSASLFLVGSYLDMAGLGCSAVVVTNGDKRQAANEASQLARRFWRRRFEFEVETVSVADAVARGRAIEGEPPRHGRHDWRRSGRGWNRTRSRAARGGR